MNTIIIDNETLLDLISHYCHGSGSDKAIYFYQLKDLLNKFGEIKIYKKLLAELIDKK